MKPWRKQAAKLAGRPIGIEPWLKSQTSKALKLELNGEGRTATQATQANGVPGYLLSAGRELCPCGKERPITRRVRPREGLPSRAEQAAAGSGQPKPSRAEHRCFIFCKARVCFPFAHVSTAFGCPLFGRCQWWIWKRTSQMGFVCKSPGLVPWGSISWANCCSSRHNRMHSPE